MLYCSGCNAYFRTKAFKPGKRYTCPQCSQPLSVVSEAGSDRPARSLKRYRPRASQTPDDPLVGRALADYLVEAKLGEGGMGAVYRAKHLGLDRQIALKLLSPQVAEASPTAVERFKREARAAAKLSHPNVVTIFAVGSQGGHHFIEMEYVEGESAHELAQRKGPLALKEATRIVIESAKALGAAHAAGIVHRDIKPGNIMIRNDGAVKVMDFGLAKDVTTQTRLTMGGQVVGTPYFMSPEQCEGEELDGRADLYSLGATYFYLLTLDYPYKSDSFMSIMFKHMNDPVPKVAELRPELPASVQRVINKSMAKSIQSRYATAEAMIADLNEIMADAEAMTAPGPETVTASAARRWVRTSTRMCKRVWPLVVGAVVLLLLLVAIGRGVRRSRRAKAQAPIVAPEPAPANSGQPRPAAGVRIVEHMPPPPAPIMAVVPAYPGFFVLGAGPLSIDTEAYESTPVAEVGRLRKELRQLKLLGMNTVVIEPLFAPDGKPLLLRLAKREGLRVVALHNGLAALDEADPDEVEALMRKTAQRVKEYGEPMEFLASLDYPRSSQDVARWQTITAAAAAGDPGRPVQLIYPSPLLARPFWRAHPQPSIHYLLGPPPILRPRIPVEIERRIEAFRSVAPDASHFVWFIPPRLGPGVRAWPAHLRLMANLCMAYGVKGLFFDASKAGLNLDDFVGPDERVTDYGLGLKRLTNEARLFGQTLIRLQPAKNIAATGVLAVATTLASKRGEKFVFVVNADPRGMRDVFVSITADPGVSRLWAFDILKGKHAEGEWAKPKLKLKLRLDVGEGRLLRLH